MDFRDRVFAAIEVIRRDRHNHRESVSEEAVNAGEQLAEPAEETDLDTISAAISAIREEIPYEYPQVAVWWYSVLLKLKKDPSVFLEFIKFLRSGRDAFSVNTQYFLFHQLKYIRFRFPELHQVNIKKELWCYFKEIVDGFAREIHEPLEWIPLTEREDGTVLVITEQFLVIQHGPTKTALDRCGALIAQMKKRVLLINTAEALSREGRIPFMGEVIGNYMTQMCEMTEQKWKGIIIPYHQCSNGMPNCEELAGLLCAIRKMAPGYVIAIGGSGMLSNLVSRMLPVLTVGLKPSDLEFTATQYQTSGCRLPEHDRDLLAELGFKRNHVIESVFTSGLKPQTEKITRNELGVGNDKFLIIIVGTRLDDEVTDEFLQMLDDTVFGDMRVAFLGIFRKYEEYLEKYPGFRTYALNMGFCEDILSRLEVCDLYVNPLRQGGGTSCVEAMHKGLPVVTMEFGDVSVNAGKEFCVKDYDEMKAKILRYYEDKEYYRRMSDAAKKRSDMLLDTETEFVRIMNVFKERAVEDEAGRQGRETYE